MTTTSDPASVPKAQIDVCEVCGATYGPSFDKGAVPGKGIYDVWLAVHARPRGEAPHAAS